MSVLDPDYRPWPKIKLDRPEVVQQYDRLETNLGATRALLLSHQQATDSDEYGTVLKEVLALFGEGIRESLQRTMGDFLEETNGAKAESQLEDWERAKYSKALATNNAAERPFAVIKELLHSFPSMRLCFLSAISHARVNGTFRVAEAGGKFHKTKHRAGVKAGAAMAADPGLTRGMHTMTSIRDTNPSDLTKLQRQWDHEDNLACAAHRQTRDANNLKEQMRLMEGRAERANTAREVPLLVTVR